MSIIYNGTTIPNTGIIRYNGTSLNKVIYNGTTVWEKFNGYLYYYGNEYTSFTGGWNDNGYSMHGSAPEGGTYSKTSSYIQVSPTTGSRHAKTIGTNNLINLTGYSRIIFDCTVPYVRDDLPQNFPLTTYIPYSGIKAYVFFGLDYTTNGIFYGIADQKSMVEIRADYGYYKYDWSEPYKNCTWVRLNYVKLV